MSQKQGHVLSSCNTNDSDWSIVEEAGIIYKWHKLNFGTFMRTKKNCGYVIRCDCCFLM